MADYYCPDCGDRPMRQSHPHAIHICEGCLKRFVVIELPRHLQLMVSILDSQTLTPVPSDNLVSLNGRGIVDGGA